MSFETPGFFLTRKNVSIYRDLVSIDIVDELLPEAIKLRDSGRFILSRGYDRNGRIINLTREQRGTHQCPCGTITKKLNEHIREKLNLYSENAFFVDEKKLVRTQDYFLWYDAGFGITLHADDSSNGSRDYHRVLTVLIYLNNDYEGGEIVFPDHDLKIKPEKGEMIAFPSNRLFKHEVTPIISGHRFAIMQTYNLLRLNPIRQK